MKKKENIDIIIKSHLRHNVLLDYLESIRDCFNGKIIVADDSVMSLENKIKIEKFCELHQIKHDSGLSAGRNYLVDIVENEFFIYSDDDHLVHDKNFIEEMKDCMDRNGADLVSASVLDGPGSRWFGHFLIKENTLYLNFYKTNLEEFRCRFCPNFFLAKKEIFKKYKLKWDENLKLEEHEDFFMRVPNCLKIFHYKKPMIKRSNKREDNQEYMIKRHGDKEKYREIFKKKWNLKNFREVLEIDWQGQEPPVFDRGIKLI